MDIFERVMQYEGGAKVSNDPDDSGGRTQWGIAEKSNPQAWADGRVTEQEARAIFEQKYVKWPKFDQIPDSHKAVREQLIDFGFNSGPTVAVQKLQTILGTKVDGVLGPNTIGLLKQRDAKELNNLLVKERVKMFARIIQKVPSQAKFAVGWLDRAMSFIV